MNIEAFIVLKAIVDEGSFALAAEKLGKAQSAISYQVKKLENFAGTPLFNRDEYRAVLTDMGLAMLQEGNKLLVQFQRIQHLAEHKKQGWEPRLEVVMDGVLPIGPVLRALKSLDNEHVPTSIQLSVEYLTGVQQRFLKDNAQIMLVKDFKPETGLIAEELPAINIVLVVSQHHALAQLKHVEALDLNQHIELVVRDSWLSSAADQALTGGEKAYYMSDFGQKKQALLMGLGFGWMPDYLILDELKHQQLVLLNIDQSNTQKIRPFLVYRDDQRAGRARALLCARLHEEFRTR